MTWSSKRFEKKLVNFEEKDPSFFFTVGPTVKKFLGSISTGLKLQVDKFLNFDLKIHELSRLVESMSNT